MKPEAMIYSHSIAALLLLLALPTLANTQEASTASNELRADTHAIAQMLEAKNVAILTILQKLTACNAKGFFYRPAAAGADSDGCVAPAAKLVQSYAFSNDNVYGTTPIVSAAPGSHDLCYASASVQYPSGGCSVRKVGERWELINHSFSDSRSHCQFRCFNISQ